MVEQPCLDSSSLAVHAMVVQVHVLAEASQTGEAVKVTW